jgi:hypothetical protein
MIDSIHDSFISSSDVLEGSFFFLVAIQCNKRSKVVNSRFSYDGTIGLVTIRYVYTVPS